MDSVLCIVKDNITNLETAASYVKKTLPAYNMDDIDYNEPSYNVSNEEKNSEIYKNQR